MIYGTKVKIFLFAQMILEKEISVELDLTKNHKKLDKLFKVESIQLNLP
jgi:hypothetical protein